MNFEIYDAKDGWRWRLRAGNGRIVADGAEAYDSKSNVKRAIHDLLEAVDELVNPDQHIVEVDQ